MWSRRSMRDLFVDLKLARIDDAHVQPGLDGVVEKHRVHGLAHGFVAAEPKETLLTPPDVLAAGTASSPPTWPECPTY